MATYKSLFTSFLSQKGLKFQDIHERAVRIVFDGNNMSSIGILAIFDDDNGKRVHFICPDVGKVPEDKLFPVLLACNTLHNQYRYCTFCVSDSMELRAEGDAVLDADTAGEECFEIVLRMIKIIDDAYPVLQKAIWS